MNAEQMFFGTMCFITTICSGGLFIIMVKWYWDKAKGTPPNQNQNYNNLGDHLGDYIEEGEWEHGKQS